MKWCIFGAEEECTLWRNYTLAKWRVEVTLPFPFPAFEMGCLFRKGIFFRLWYPEKSPLFNYLKLLLGSKWNFYEFKKPPIAPDFSSDNEWEMETFSYEIDEWHDVMTNFTYPTFSITLNFVRNSGYHNFTLIIPIIFICIIANLGLILPGIFLILNF